MIENVVSIGLPIDERLEIKKNTLKPIKPVDKQKRISIVTGTHGDELEGQFICYELVRRIKEHPELLCGTVDVYPALNPMGIDSITRGIPGFDLDMNRIFPGSEDGSMAEYAASKIVSDLKGSDVCIDIHSSNIFLTETPQIRISEETAKTLVPLAEKMNVDLIWVHGAATVLHATLAHTMNSLGVPTLVVEVGVGMRITRQYGLQITEGIFSLMHFLGIWAGEVTECRKPRISDNPDEVSFINAPVSGIFLPRVKHCDRVKKGELIGEITEPMTGEILSGVCAPSGGMVFTIREYPVVTEGALIARILGGTND